MLFPENIECIIRDIAELLSQSSLSISSQAFQDGFYRYFEGRETPAQCYEIILPTNAPTRMVKIIDDEKERKLVQSMFPLIKDLICVIKKSFPPSSCGNSDYSHVHIGNNSSFDMFFKCAVDYIMQYNSYLNIVRIPSRFGVSKPELEQFWDKKDQLIDVSTFEPLHKAFYYAPKDIVVYPDYRHNYGLSELFTNLYKEIRKTGRLSVSSSHFSCKSEYPKAIYVQEEKIFGMPFNKKNFKRLFKKEYGVYKYPEHISSREKIMSIPLYALQYVICPTGNDMVSFMLEEIIDISFEKPNVYLDGLKCGTDSTFFVRNRLVHFIFDNKKDSIVHLDLSYLYYDDVAYFKRIEQRLCGKTEKATIKHKIFRIDGLLEFDIACSLIGGALEANHNPEVKKLLSGED